jgi:protein-tyrosine phosphatase
MRQKTEGRPKSVLEEEFDKLSILIDDRKPLSVASSEENRSKNRHETALPFDRNRVILTPVPGRDYSTYINASFIEGYDNSESFIVTQDPLESTVRDFWRMVLEHNVAVIVMLSEAGAEPSSCITYWPDDEQETTHDHITVKHVSTVTMPAYIQREFLVRSTRNREEVRTTQLQFLSWSVDPKVPGLEDDSIPPTQQLGSFVSIAVEALAARGRPRANQLQSGPACVHCNSGSVRSSVLLALCILIEQARTEGYVDVFSTVRKLRSQRALMVQHSTQYAFIYDALAYYLRTHPSSLPSTP